MEPVPVTSSDQSSGSGGQNANQMDSLIHLQSIIQNMFSGEPAT